MAARRPDRDASTRDTTAEEARDIPWERRSELGIAATLPATLRLFIVSPADTFSAAGRRLRSPLTFALLLGAVGAIFDAFSDAILTYVFSFEGPNAERLREVFELTVYGRSLEGPIVSAVGCWLGLIVGVPVLLLLLPVFLGFWSGVSHLVVRLVALPGPPAAGFAGTLTVVCYSLTAATAQVVPVVGDFVGPVWMIVLQAIGLATVHGLSRGRAAVAAVAPAIVLAALVAAGSLWIDLSAAGAGGDAPPVE